MIRQSLNKQWIFVAHHSISVQGLAHRENQTGLAVDLPHDAMIHEQRTPDAASKNQSGFYPGGIYCYRKTIFAPEEWRKKQTVLEFEGVYRNASVYVNGALAGSCANGYTEYLVDITPFLRLEEENEIQVVVNNEGQPSSRWYSGSGLYRGVNLLQSSPVMIEARGAQWKTVWADGEAANLAVSIPLKNAYPYPVRLVCKTEVTAPDGETACVDELPVTLYGNTSETLLRKLQIHQPNRWDCGHPHLYTWRITLEGEAETFDAEEGHLGIRTLAADSKRGLLLNEKPVKLRGACIHHDNGILGACAFPEAEERRIRILKEAGFNCVRSAHNPASRELLDACDRLGMLVMDEYSDVWSMPKNPFDDAAAFEKEWKNDLKALVRKDYNHPSVILYCLGNEVPEASSEHGAWLCRQMDSFIKQLDDSRLTLNAISITLSCSPLFRPILGELLKDKMPAGGNAGQGKGMDATSAANLFASLMNGPLGDALYAHPKITEAIRAFEMATDITGLNYAPSRYALEGQLYPDRLILGTEDYPADIVRLWGLVEQYPHVIGDMTWTGWDYIGEAGIGIYYYDGTMNFTPHWPDRLAYIGDINILGYRRPVSYWRETIYGIRKAPYIAVDRMEHNGEKVSQTAWMVKNQISSWTWHGCEGKEAHVDVFSDAEAVELVLNGVSLGIQIAGRGHDFRASFTVPYQPGRLEAYAIREGKRAETCCLETADDPAAICPECGEEINAKPDELLFIPVQLTDQAGRPNMQAAQTISVTVDGNAQFMAMGSASPSGLASYDEPTWETFDGQVMAAIRAGANGEAAVSFKSDGGLTGMVRIRICPD